MIAEKKYEKTENTSKRIETVSVDWLERDKKLLRKTTSAGEEIGIRIDAPLNDGDIIYEDDQRIITVEITPCELISVKVSSMEDMGRLCFELGNRHLSLSVTKDCVKCPFDEPTFEYLKKLGFGAVKVCEKFTGFIECKAHSHTHSAHSHGGHDNYNHDHEC